MGTAILGSAIAGTPEFRRLRPEIPLVSKHSTVPPKSYRRACVDSADLC
jgi:hypothetical protein